jgi:3-deoxy-D-manno-octulosonate 8-phosphate phosphatase (KDO 8-P phosphatase)
MHQTRFLHTAEALRKRAQAIKAVLFDWDGVFNDGWKDLNGGSPFSEVGSLGVNMLRFGLWLRHGVIPPAAVLTGQVNALAEKFVRREHFQAIYMGFINKPDAYDQFLLANGLKPEEVAYFFDDAIDLPVARQCGLRVLIGRRSGERFTDYVIERGDADIVTACSGGDNGLREGTEAVLELLGNFAEVFNHRAAYSETYQRYLRERNATEPSVRNGTR